MKYKPGQKINREELIKKIDALPLTKMSSNAGCTLLKPNAGDVSNFLNWIKRQPNLVTQGFIPDCPYKIAKAILNSGVMHFAGQWNLWNSQTWYYDKAPAYPNGPGIPHHPARGEPKEVIEQRI